MERLIQLKFSKLIFLYFNLIFFSISFVNAQVSGTVFRDFNGNGIKDVAEPLVAGVIVKAYNTTGTQCGTTQTTTSASAPNYTISGCSGSVRIEFEIPSTGCQINNAIDYSALNATIYGSSVQFVTGNSTNVNFAINYPGDYSGTTSQIPKILNVVQRAHDPIPTPVPPYNDESYTANQSSVVASGYFADGYNFTAGENFYAITEAQRQVDHTKLALARQTGTLWGNAYSKQSGKMFVSSFLRRHAGMGPGGPGAIYMLDPNSPNLTANLLFASLDALGFPTHAASGAMNIKNNVTRNLIAQPNYTPSTDADAYEQVGKTSLGDLDISEDGKFLFVVNLFDRKVYRIDLQNAQNPQTPTATQISSYSIPDPCGSITNAGDYRPFGLKVYRGKLYIGIVCSGQTSADPTPPDWRNLGMRFFVYSYDLGTNNTPVSPTEIYQQGVTYRDSDEIQAPGNPPSGFGSARWKPWTTSFTTSDNFPMLTDIEFDNQGNMLLGITDRNGYQTGGGNNDLTGNAPFTKAYANGDILKLLKNGSCGFTLATGSYYQNDFYQDQSRWGIPYSNGADPYTHAEIGLGGIGVHHFGDRDEVISTSLNPVFATSNGYIALNNQNGTQVRANEIWYDNCNPNTQGCFWKAGGLGDLEIMGYESPLEIGNRVWMDTDSDGVQDADEMGLDGVTVKLFQGTTLVSTKTTANGGQYYFNTADGLLPNTAYTIRIEAANIPSGKFVTLKDQPTGGVQDMGDNDAALVGANADITYTTGNAGENNHTLDFGFSAALTCSSTVTAIPGTCNSATNQYTLTGTVTFSNPPSTGTLTVQISGGGSQVFNAPFTSPQSYSIAGQTSDGVNHTVTATFSADGTCTSNINYTAPASCSGCPPIQCGTTTVQKN